MAEAETVWAIVDDSYGTMIASRNDGTGENYCIIHGDVLRVTVDGVDDDLDIPLSVIDRLRQLESERSK